jgi:hypothetical protein
MTLYPLKGHELLDLKVALSIKTFRKLLREDTQTYMIKIHAAPSKADFYFRNRPKIIISV